MGIGLAATNKGTSGDLDKIYDEKVESIADNVV